MKVVLVQMNVESGNFEANFNQIKRYVEQAKQEACDLIIFPEMCVSGYLLQDKFLDDDICAYIHSFNDRIKDLSDNIGIIFGSLFYGPLSNVTRGKDGRTPRFNSAFFAYNKNWVKRESKVLDGLYIKHLLPNYRFFDDERYFVSGTQLSKNMISPFLFERNGVIHRIGLEICEDLWDENYSLKIGEQYYQQDVHTIINISASPYTIGKEKARDKQIFRLQKLYKNTGFTLYYVNCCGMQNTGKNVLVFDGGSGVFDEKEMVWQCNDQFREEYSVYEGVSTTFLSIPQEEKIWNALQCAIYEFDRQMFPFKPKWIIGLSGGIDSCVSAALFSSALSSERIIAYNLATQYNSVQTKDAARNTAMALGIELREGSIESTYHATLDMMKEYGYDANYDSLVYENIQARLRGHALSTFASIEKGVIINNGNKIEVALGYATLYGDSIGAVSMLGDLSKIQIFELAAFINKKYQKEIIDKRLIPIVHNYTITCDLLPSAELKQQQVDPMKWYYHDLLIQRLCDYPTGNITILLQQYLDGSIMNEPIGKWMKTYGLDNPRAFIEDLEWILKQFHQAIFKRLQMPPILALSRGSFGNDYREAQLKWISSDLYRDLRNRILSL